MRRICGWVAAAIGLLPAATALAAGERITVMTTNLTNPHFQLVRIGADRAARQLGATVTHFVPSRPDSIPEQMGQLEDVVIKKADAVVFVPADYRAMAAGVEKLNAAGIPVVNVTTRLEGARVVAFVGSDDYALCKSTGQRLLRELGGRGNVIIIEGLKGNIVSMDRVRGFNDALKEFPEVRLLASQTGNFQRLVANQVMENMVQAHSRIDGVLVANDAMASGVIEALEGAGRRARVVSINGTQEAIDAVKADKLLATADYSSFLQGCAAVMSAVRHLRSQPIVANRVFPATLIDTSNVKEFDLPVDQRQCPSWDALPP